jgi:hypothetical protein
MFIMEVVKLDKGKSAGKFALGGGGLCFDMYYNGG